MLPANDICNGPLRRSTRQEALVSAKSLHVPSISGRTTATKTSERQIGRGELECSSPNALSVVVKHSIGRLSKTVRFEGASSAVAKECLKRKPRKLNAETLVQKKPRSMKTRGNKMPAGNVAASKSAGKQVFQDPADPEDEAEKKLGEFTKLLHEFETGVTLKSKGRWLLEGFSAGPVMAEGENGEGNENDVSMPDGKDGEVNGDSPKVEIQDSLVQEDFRSFDLYEGVKYFSLGWWGKQEFYYNAFHECKAGRIILSHVKCEKIGRNFHGRNTISGYLGDMRMYLKHQGKPYKDTEFAQLYWNEAEAASLPADQRTTFYSSLMNGEDDDDD